MASMQQRSKMATLYLLIVIIAVLLFIIIKGGLLAADIYFMSYNFDKHPKLKALLEYTIDDICREEGIQLFTKPYKEINKNRSEENEVVGMYIYTVDKDYQETVNKCYAEIAAIEIKYGKTYQELCALNNVDCVTTKEDYILPKILIADSLMKYGTSSYYSTVFHELGHHFAVKEKGRDHDEMDADRHAFELVKIRLPFYFRLFYDFHYTYRLGESQLNNADTLKAYYSYFKYLLLKNYGTEIRYK